MDVCLVKRVLLVQAIYDGVKINLKKIWVDVPSWECRVLALKSTISDYLVHFYVIGWDEKALQALNVEVEIM
jgi:hypothetical protein